MVFTIDFGVNVSRLSDEDVSLLLHYMANDKKQTAKEWAESELEPLDIDSCRIYNWRHAAIRDLDLYYSNRIEPFMQIEYQDQLHIVTGVKIRCGKILFDTCCHNSLNAEDVGRTK